MKKNRGFTLLEILVVVGIISVLTAMGVISFSSAQKKARDAKRKSDLKAVQNAMEQYYSICGYKYPTPMGGSVPSNLSNSISCTSPNTNIMPTVPTDPLTNNHYVETNGSSSDYTICVPTRAADSKALETESGSFCVSNQQ